MMTRANRAYCSLPVPNFSAIGIMPMIVAKEVIKMGRRRTRQEVITANHEESRRLCLYRAREQSVLGSDFQPGVFKVVRARNEFQCE
jgi:hypothetical protein